MEDVKRAWELVEQHLPDTGIEKQILDYVTDLLKQFDDDRERLLREMLDRLMASNSDGLRDLWSTNCGRATDLLEHLENDIVSHLDLSEANDLSAAERMSATGLSTFLAGERKIWERAAEGDIPDAAVLMAKLADEYIDVIKKCEEDLRKVREDDRFIDALIVKTFGSITEQIKDLAAKYSLTAGPRLLAKLMLDPVSKRMAKDTLKEIEKLLADNYAAAKQKRVVRQMVTDNVDLLTEAHDQMGEEWIDTLYDKGARAAGGLRDAGRSGDYDADDWDWFGTFCTGALGVRRDACKTLSRQMFDGLLADFKEEYNLAFTALTNSPAVLENFKSEMDETFGSIKDLVKAAEEYQATLEESPYVQAAKETLEDLRQRLDDGIELILSSTDESNDEVKG